MFQVGTDEVVDLWGGDVVRAGGDGVDGRVECGDLLGRAQIFDSDLLRDNVGFILEEEQLVCEVVSTAAAVSGGHGDVVDCTCSKRESKGGRAANYCDEKMMVVVVVVVINESTQPSVFVWLNPKKAEFSQLRISVFYFILFFIFNYYWSLREETRALRVRCAEVSVFLAWAPNSKIVRVRGCRA